MNKIIILGLLVFMVACSPKTEKIEIRLNKFAKSLDSNCAMGGFQKKDSSSIHRIYPDLKSVPTGWQDVEVYYGTIDFPQAVYQAYHQGVIDEAECMQWFNGWGLDTAVFSVKPVNVFIAAAIGVNAQKDTCIVFDNNGNLDLSDDIIMLYRDQHPVPVAFERIVDGCRLADTTYVASVFMYGQMLLKYMEYTSQTIQVDGQEYTCKTIPTGNDYDTSTWIEFSTPDTTLLYHPKQYALLGNAYYFIDSLSVDGRYISLTKTPDALSHETVQIGFRPYSFTTVTMDGDTINFPDDFKGKYVLLDFWSTGCGPCIQEIENTYPELYKRYKDAGFEILSIGDNTTADIQAFKETHTMPWLLVADRDQERVLQKLYKINYFPNLYLINPEGRICADDRTLRDSSLEKTLQELFTEVPAMTSYQPDAFEKLLKDNPDIQLVDVRTSEEYAAGSIPDAKNIDVKKDDFLSKAEAELDKSRPVAVYCRSGVRSRKAAYQLIDKGYKVYNLDKGYTSWIEAKKK